jgi:hypothetical protein
MAAMAILANRGLRSAVEYATAAGMLLGGIAALPLGLESLASAPVVGAGYALQASAGQGGPIAPLCALFIRLCACLPVGDVATRANLASVLAAALAARSLARLVQELLTEVAPVHPGLGLREGVCEAIAAAGAVACVTLGRELFVSTTSAGPAAVTLAVLAAFWVRAVRIVRTPGGTRDGLWLALWAGIGFGADPLVVLVCWPVALVLGVRAFRRGERWPLCAPALAVAGAGLGLYAAVVAGSPLGWAAGLGGTLVDVSRAWKGLAASGVAAPAAAVLGALGPIAALVAAVGTVLLAARAPRQALLFALAMATAALVGAGRAGSPAGFLPTGAAWAALMAPLAIPLAAGIAHLASKLGGARAAAAMVIAVVALVWPVLDGGARRWARPAILPERLLRVVHAATGPRAEVNPGSRAMEDLLDYGRALGLRPDLTLVRQPMSLWH